MPLYTFHMGYKGGDYLFQVHADTPELASKIWAEQLEYKSVKGIGPKGKERLIKEMELDTPVPIKGIKNTWCSIALINGALAMIHFTETVE
jgi:hypothetical protein